MGLVTDLVDRARAALSIPPTGGDVAQVEHFSDPNVATAFGINTDHASITRRDAMRVPAFARGRNTICGTVGLLEVHRVKGDQVDHEAPFLLQPDPNASRQHTITWTVDDLLCHGIAWWKVTRRDPARFPAAAKWIPARTVQVTPEGVFIGGERQNPADLIRFDGHHEGVLAYGSDTLRAALALELAVKRYADNPEPTSLLFDKRPLDADVADLDDTAVDALLARWRTKNATTTTRWLNRMVGYQRLSYTPTELDLTGARQQAAVQVARLLGMPSRSVNAPSESGMTYQNVAADRLETLDTACAPYMIAIEQRLSMGDVTPRGWRVRFDRDGFAIGTTNERLKNAQLFLAAGLGSRDEARSRYLSLGPDPANTPPPARRALPTPNTPNEDT